MARKRKVAKSTGADERCRCGEPADWELTGHTIGEARQVRRRGHQVVEQPFDRYYLCDPCCRGEVLSERPPRAAVALPHHEKRLRAEEREAVRALIGDAKQERLGDDWGLPA